MNCVDINCSNENHVDMILSKNIAAAYIYRAGETSVFRIKFFYFNRGNIFVGKTEFYKIYGLFSDKYLLFDLYIRNCLKTVVFYFGVVGI